jgi:CubicO group peptidase (beta-lactamase class C family)
MTSTKDLSRWFEKELPQLIDRANVPAASVAVSINGNVARSASGVLSTATGVTATVDSVFQIGSITKVWTATLIFQLVDEGKVDIDDLVTQYVPNFRTANPKLSSQIRVRHLLSHTSGIEGDIWLDTGRGANALELYVDLLVNVKNLFPPGMMYSYSNAGYSVLGRVVEVVRQRPFDDCLREYLIGPLKLAYTAVDAEEAIRYRAAIGHLGPQNDPAPFWSLFHSAAPAGASLSTTARDLLTFVEMHMSEGRIGSEKTLLTPASVAQMQQRQVERPGLGYFGSASGLGWEFFDQSDEPVFGHDGATLGQESYLRVLPARDVSIAILTNGGNSAKLANILLEGIYTKLGVQTRPLPIPSQWTTVATEPERFIGVYESTLYDSDVSKTADGRLWVTTIPKGVARALGESDTTVEILPISEDTFVAATKTAGRTQAYAFIGADPDGRAQFLHRGRADKRQSPSSNA